MLEVVAAADDASSMRQTPVLFSSEVAKIKIRHDGTDQAASRENRQMKLFVVQG